MKKLLWLWLFLIIIIVFAAASCAENDSGKPDTTEQNAGISDSGETNTPDTPERFIPNLPEITFNGYEFRALVHANNMYSSFTFSVEEETGDILNDAIYKRNKYIEEKYDVIFSQTEIDDIWQLSGMFTRSVMAGSDDFDLSSQLDWFNLTTQGYSLLADKLPHLDITQPWYLHDVNEVYSIGNKKIAAISDECLSAYDVVLAFCFNKDLIRDLGLEDPYALVKSGAWTYEKFFGMCRTAAADIDGDGRMTDTDRYGILSQFDELLAPFWVSSEVWTVIKDSDGMLALNLAGNEKLLSVLDKIHQNIYGGEKIFFDAHPESGDRITNFQVENASGGGFIDISRQQFENNLGLFLTARLVRIPNLRAMDADFGIVPYPKSDENQKQYYSMSNGAWAKIVPNHVADPERTSIILEALAAESKNIVIPAYKEICLKTKFTRDDESSEMLDIIFDNILEDLGATVFWPTIRNALIEEVRKNGNFTSVIEKQSARLEKVLNDVNGLVDVLE